MRKFIFGSILLLFLFNYPSTVFASGPKYTMRQRFGVGSDGGDAMKLLGNGWYFNWEYSGGKKVDNNIEYMGLLGAGANDVLAEQAPDSPASPTCQKYRNYILGQGKQLYPDYMMWTIGNEIGWGDGTKTANDYASNFIKWRDCLKDINPNFQVGSGALVALDHQIPSHGGFCATNTSETGRQFFKDYINEIKRLDSSKLPDFIVNHAYTYCRPGGITSDNFKTEMYEQRQLMKDLGLQNKDLIIKEWADFSDNSINYLKDTVNYLMTATDQNLGNPDDEYRLVQKWAWFLFVNTDSNPEWKNAWLYNSHTGDLTALGQAYKALLPDPYLKTCSVSLSSNTINTGQSVTVNFSGNNNNVNSGGNADTVRLWIEKADGGTIDSIGACNVNCNSWSGSDGCWNACSSSSSPPQVRYYLKGDCQSSGNSSCSGSTTFSGLPTGNYIIHCDLQGSSNPCSGAPFCSYHGGSWNCSPYISCSSTDHTSLTVNNPPTPIPPTPIPPSPTPVPPTPIPIPGDIYPVGHPDGRVDIYDYNILISDFGKTGSQGFILSDIDRDGKVGIFDYNILIGNFGR